MWPIDDLDKFGEEIQDHFTDGLVTIIGSGLSAGEGLPGMWGLSNHLQEEVTKILRDTSENWDKIYALLKNDINLEEALTRVPPNPEVEELIVKLTADFIEKGELQAIKEVINGKRELKLTSLLNNVLFSDGIFPIITTNYDRLIEVAAEAAGYGVDTSFVGNYLSSYNPQESKSSFCIGVKQGVRKAVLKYRKRIVLCKPHGSLDWYMHDNNPVRFSFNINEPRLIITPGLNKYKIGYERPFDGQRELANKQIDAASRYFVIGYGFADSHLETHLTNAIQKGKKTLILTHSLSDKAKQLVSNYQNTVAIVANSTNATESCIVHSTGSTTVDSNIWDLSEFVKKFLKP